MVEGIATTAVIASINLGFDKTVGVRADMDALPIKEQANVEYKSDTNMHACGHDIHTAILLGVAKLLKKYENQLENNIKFMFQPAEELLEGAKDMINSGILNGVDEAYMIHVLVPASYDTGTVIISDNEITAPSCDYINIDVIGKSVHGAMPNLGVDTIKISSMIVNKLINQNNDYTLTFGSIIGGNTFNIIPDRVNLKGTLRTYDENVRFVVKNKIIEISNEIAKKFDGKVEIDFPTSAPVLINNLKLVEEFLEYVDKDMLDVVKTSELDGFKASGSEDFAYISQMVPSVMLSICAGKKEDGYIYPLHNENVIFDENVLYYGILLFFNIALKKAH